MNKRQLKKADVENRRLGKDLEWLGDLNAYLLETITDEEPQVEYIVQRFKRRITKGNRRKLYGFITPTRLRQYVSGILGPAYGRECKR